MEQKKRTLCRNRTGCSVRFLRLLLFLKAAMWYTEVTPYTGDFEATWRDVQEGCTALLEELKPKENG